MRWQAEAGERLGSPLYAELLHRAAEEVLAGDVVLGVLAGHEDDPGPSALALRLMGAVHRLVLRGDAPQLARHYPSVGGAPRDPWPAFVATLRERRTELRRLVDHPVQTNETRAAPPCWAGFLEVTRHTRLLRLGRPARAPRSATSRVCAGRRAAGFAEARAGFRVECG